jgi:murein DD-endopeptidase MepM/ murein hydrolase activator NlpD
VPHRLYDARHRTGRRAAGSHRLLTGLVLPTTAALALALTTTGAAVQADPTAQASPVVHQVQLHAQSREHARAQAELAASRAAAAQRAAMAAARAEAAQRAARAAQRKAVQARLARAAALARAKARQRAAALARARAWRLPITHYTLTSGFGHRWGRLHAGNDFAAPIGSRLVAMSTGRVTFAGAQAGYGNKVEIRYWDGTASSYGHMDRVTARVGQKVAPGTLVGYSGNTGHSTGPHLHLEIHPHGDGPVDPRPWLRAHRLRP